MRAAKPSEGAVRIATYDGLDGYVRAFAAGKLNLLVLVGAPGLQKSRVVRDALPDACWIEGHATPLCIYLRLWERRDEPVVIDDVDSLYADRGAVRLLKGLCQTERRKTVAWESSTQVLDRQNVPRRFATSSQVLIIANAWKTLNVHVAALEDRGHLLHFEPDVLEVRTRSAAWFWDQEIFDWIGAHLHLIGRPSMRVYRAAWELKGGGDGLARPAPGAVADRPAAPGRPAFGRPVLRDRGGSGQGVRRAGRRLPGDVFQPCEAAPAPGRSAQDCPSELGAAFRRAARPDGAPPPPAWGSRAGLDF
jgi:hypothetical protein